MKTMPVVGAGIVLSAFLLSGCVVSEQVYLQDATITAPTGHLPVRVAQDVEPGKLTISPSLAVSSRTTTDARVPGHSKVGPSGAYVVDTVFNSNGTVELHPGTNAYPYTGTNLHWKTPSINAMLSMDYTLSKSVALEGGLCYASGEGVDLWGGHIGLGLMSEGEVLGMRISTGFQWTPASYDVNTAVETTIQPLFSSATKVYTTLYNDVGSGSPFGWYAGMTLNTRVHGWWAQPFVNITLSKERFFSYEPSHLVIVRTGWTTVTSSANSTAEASAVLVLLSPGISFSVGPAQRVLIGARWAFAPDMVNQDGSAMPTRTWFAPFIQIDLGL